MVKTETTPSLDEVFARRKAMYKNGFRPIRIPNAVIGDKKTGKGPTDHEWHIRVRDNPPPSVIDPPIPTHLNTGMSSSGLIIFDVDIDDKKIADHLLCILFLSLGSTIIRRREGSPRYALIYKSSDPDQDAYRIHGANGGKIEVLAGLGGPSQLVAYGQHYSGAYLEWPEGGPADTALATLPIVSHADISKLRPELQAIIGEPEAGTRTDAPRARSGKAKSAEELAPPTAEALLALLRDMPNPPNADYYTYRDVCLAVQGCLRGMAKLGTEYDEDEVIEAVVDWICLHMGDDVREKETDLWQQRWLHRTADLAGWSELLKLAKFCGADVSEQQRQVAQRRVIGDFGDIGPEPDPADDDSASGPDSGTDAAAVYRFRRGENPYGNRRWLIHETLPETGVAFLAGQYSAGKTFVALDAAYAVMTGTTFAGMDVDRCGGVLFLAAEGEAELPVRLEAIMRAHGDVSRDLPFIWRDEIPTLLGQGGERKLIKAVREAVAAFKEDDLPLALVVVDTVAAAAGWDDENNAAEAQNAIRVLKALAKAAGALVLAIDHHGKDKAAGVRGSTAKAAGAEAVLSVLCDKSDSGGITNRRLAWHKVRGAAGGREVPFDLPTAHIGEDVKGRPITTCTVEWNTEGRITQARPVLPDQAERTLKVLRKLVAANGVSSIPEATWREAFEEQHVSPAAERKNRVKAFNRALTTLLDAGAVMINDGQVSISPAWRDERPVGDFGNVADPVSRSDIPVDNANAATGIY